MSELLYPRFIICYHQIVLLIGVVPLVLKVKAHAEHSPGRIRFTAVRHINILV